MVKLDENLGIRGKKIFEKHGFDVLTVFDQNLQSAADDDLIQICNVEKRTLVTLDMDFANVLIYNPKRYAGIAVIRLSQKTTPADLYSMVEILARQMKIGKISGKLWIVQKAGIREYQPDN